MEFNRKDCDLDQLIRAHNQYLNDITSKILLTHDQSHESLNSLIMKIFQSILLFEEQFKKFLVFASNLKKSLDKEKLKNYANQCIKSKESNSISAHSVMTQGQLKSLDLIRKEMESIHHTFHQELSNLIDCLSTHGDQNLRLLSVRFDFNEFYSV